MKNVRTQLLGIITILLFMSAAGSVFAGEPLPLSKGQSIYVPAYSHIFISNREQRFLLTVTLSIRNIDTRHPITITSVDYYDTQGRLIKKYLNHTVNLNVLQSIHYIVPQKDDKGGAGANFLVGWKSSVPVNPPIVESVMIGAEGQQGISFTSRGQVISTTD